MPHGCLDLRAPTSCLLCTAGATDLNFYMVATYKALAEMEPIVGAHDGFAAMAEQSAAALREMMWDPATSFFYGIDRRNNQRVMIFV